MPGGALEGEEQRTSGKSSTRSSSAGGITSYFVGRKLDEHRGAFILDYPVEGGSVVDGGWDAMELLWEVSSCVVNAIVVLDICWGCSRCNNVHFCHLSLID